MLRSLLPDVRLSAPPRSLVPAKTSVAQAIPLWMNNVPLSPATDARSLMDSGYRQNIVVFCCVNELATSIAGLPLRAKTQHSGSDLPRTHPLQRLLRRPNPDESIFELIEGAWINLKSTGTCYIHKARNKAGMPVELWNLRPDRMKIIPGTKGVTGYEYRIQGHDPQFVPAQDVIRIGHHDPLDDFYGLAPLAVAARAIDLDLKGLDYLRAFFLNGAAPAGILRFKEPTEPDERERIRMLWKKLYGSARGWHELAVIDALAEYQEIGSRPEKLGMDTIWTTTETRICAAFGVPPILVQLSIGLQRSTFSNYREAVKSFWSETLMPDTRRLTDALTWQLGTEFAGDPEVYCDTTGVEVLHEAMKDKREASVKLYEGGVVMLNEARAIISLPPVPDGDKFSPTDRIRRETTGDGSYREGSGEDDPDKPPTDDDEDDDE